MSWRLLTLCRVLVGLTVVAALAPHPAPIAAADDAGGPDRVAVHKTVVARADPSGTVTRARLLTRLEATGQGPATVVVPTSTDGLRDLDRLLPPRVRDGAAVWDLDLDGSEVRRSVADVPTDDLPVVVTARYLLDGEPVGPAELDGATGRVVARYQLRNVTSEPREVTYDTPGGPRTEEMAVAVPFVAGVTVGLGPGWQNVAADVGTVAATGDGARVVWTTALFEPFGALERELELTADLDGGALPEVVVDVLPVGGDRSDRMVGARRMLVDSQSEVAVLGFGLEESTAALSDVADGVGELLAGLEELGAALTAVAGAVEGTAEGSGQLAGGADQLAGALDGLAAGASGIATGTGELAGGLDQLDDVAGELAAGAATLAGGAAALAAAVDQAVTGVEELAERVGQLDLAGLAALLEGASTSLEAAADVIEMQGPLDPATQELVDDLRDLGVDLEQTATALQEDDPPDLDAVAGLDQLRQAAADVAAGAGGLAEGAAALDAGLSAHAAGAGELADGAAELAGGAGQAAGGADELAAGADELAAGLTELAGGTAGMAAGMGEAVAGVAELEGGIELLADEALDFLRRAADDTTGDVARDLARLAALDARAEDGVPYGTPEGAVATAAYRIELAGTERVALPPAGRLLIGLLVLALAGSVGGAVARRTLRPV